MDILLVNDDGIHAPGLRLLAEALRGAGHSLTVVAPDRERSAVGHGITTRDPLFVQEVPWEGIPAYSCSGTPADCTQLGLKALAPKPVDLVVSGPNNGINTAGDLLYSGHRGRRHGGREAGRESHRPVRACGGGQAHGGAGVLKAPGPAGLGSGRAPGAEHTCPRGLGGNPRRAVGPPGDCIWLGAYEERVSPGGRRYFWSTYGGYSQTEGDDDRSLLEKGYVTLTPLTYEMTDPAGFSGKECTL